MKNKLLLALVAVVLLSARNGFAYVVGFSPYFALNTWSNVCARADEDDNFLGGWTYDPLNPPVNPSLTNLGWNNGKFIFIVADNSGPDYILQATTNLSLPSVWLSLATKLIATPLFSFTNSGNTNFT